jgi:CRP-like cAMP-binding protein
MSTTAYHLSEIALFAGLEPDVRQEIAMHIHERTYEAGQVIAFAGEPCEAVHFVVSGVVRAHRLSLDGREYVLAYLGAGQVFNLVPALDGGAHLATVEAVSEAIIYSIACDRFREFVDRHTALSLAVLERLTDRVRYLSDQVEDLALHTVRTRLARFLLARAEGDLRTPRQWTQEEIAAHIGTVRDVVGRTLRSFAREGWVRRERGRLVVRDSAALRHEAMLE